MTNLTLSLRTALLVASVVTAPWLSGCGRTPAGPTCVTSTDCDGTTSCDVLTGQCSMGCGTCPIDTICADGQCHAVTGGCDKGAACPTGSVCINNQCLASGCTPACAGGSVCVNNVCVTSMPPPPPCGGDCPVGTACDGTSCVPTTPPPPAGCGTGAACPSPLVCTNGQCCLGGALCIPPPATCGNDGLCPPTFTCLADLVCCGQGQLASICLPKFTSCQGGMMCPGQTDQCLFGFCIPQSLLSLLGGLLGGGGGGGGIGMMCQSSTDCPANLQCLFGLCIPGFGGGGGPGGGGGGPGGGGGGPGGPGPGAMELQSPLQLQHFVLPTEQLGPTSSGCITSQQCPSGTQCALGYCLPSSP